MNLPVLPDSDETIALKELVEQLKISNEIALNDNKLNMKLLTQLTEMNEKLTTTRTQLDNIWNRLAGVSYLGWIALILVFMMWAILSN
jgi:hypothetical protein